MRDTTDGLSVSAVQQTLLGEAVDHAEIGVIVWNAERRYVSVNPKACDLIGTTREQLLSSQVGETNRSPEAQAAIDDILAKVPARGSMSVTRPDGNVADLEWVVFPTTLAGLPHVIGLYWESAVL
jgi:PAS domain S-box-containing protein